MPLFLVFAIILPLVGAGGTLGLSLVPRARPYTRYVALTAVGLTTILVFALRWMEPVVVVPSLWWPSLLFGATLKLQTDVALQPLALALALVTCSATLAGIARADEPHPRLTAILLALLACGFVALWSANILTMVIGWAMYDLLQAVGSIAAGGTVRMAMRGLVRGSVATLLLWGGTLLSGGGVGSGLWSLVSPESAQLRFWVGAALLRLGVYPFQSIVPNNLGAASLLLSPLMGWGLWLRLVSLNGGFPAGDAVGLGIAAVTLTLGSFLAWSCESPRYVSQWVGMGVTGTVLLAAGLAGESASAIITAGAVAWALGMAILFLKSGLDGGLLQEGQVAWWNLPSLVGALALLGVPLTLGFVTQAALLAGLTRGEHLGLGVAFFVANLFLVPSVMRCLRLSSSSPLPSRHWSTIVGGTGLGLLALPLILAGLHPPLLLAGTSAPSLWALLGMPRLVGWLLWAISLAGGGVLAWQEDVLRPRIELALVVIHDLLRLEWLYDAVGGALARWLRVFRAADEVVGGAGALLWSLLLFLLILLIWGRF
jgi:formate hydrogenlyase subunit 3/multisubunit Na+/H+ antiporter MnhD subunit